MRFDKKYITGLYPYIVVFAFIFGAFIMFFMLKTMTVDHEELEKMRKSREKTDVDVEPIRGNILAADGQLMASSLPNYTVYIDFLSGLSDKGAAARKPVTKADSTMWAKKDSLFHAGLDSICMGLHDICPMMTAGEYRKYLLDGWDSKSRYYEICPNQVLNYIQFNKLMSLPFFRLMTINNSYRYMVGLAIYPRNNRMHPFGTLAKRTLGSLYGAKDSARSGLELAFDSVLRGKGGKGHRKKVRSVYLDIIDEAAKDGSDIVSTIDVDMQDICETALKSKLEEVEAEWGVVVLLEAATGDVKSIANLDRVGGQYVETQNRALSTLMEPGSTFKTASIMVALDDGMIKYTDRVQTYAGVYSMYGRLMKDHNWHRGGYGEIDVPHTLMYSSNVGVSRLIDEHYHNQPEKFIEGLHRVGIADSLGIPFQGTATPRLIRPGSRLWSKVALPWMSIGYSTQIPPISTVTFYNAIANGGKMMRPRFVKAIQKDGEVVEELPPVVLREHICKDVTLRQIQTALYRVVNDEQGVGKRAGSKKVSISGKTGTAQVSHGKSGYSGREYLVSFCGYFPSENPKYTCIVAIDKKGTASGGGTAGPVFASIAEQITFKTTVTDLSVAQDSSSVFVPDVKNGNMSAAGKVLSALGIGFTGGEVPAGTWGEAFVADDALGYHASHYHPDSFPDLTGMGARDAIFAIESRGMKARISGVGTVVSQSVRPGGKIVKGKTVRLELGQ